MDKFDYITATIEEEKVRLEKIIEYFEDNNINNDDLLEYKERYNNVCRYLTLKGKYLNIRKRIDSFKGKLEELNETKDEYEVDNILLEDTLLSNFNSDTMGKYRNILYEDIKKEDPSIRDILYLLFEKESDYNNLVTKRTKLLKIINQNTYPKTYNTLISQDALIDKQHSILDDIFILENNIKIEEDKISICNDKYTVIGTYSVGGYNILPISSINDVKHNNESVSIVLDKYPDDDENNKIISQLTECFENAEIIYPERIKNIDSLWNDSTTIIYIGIFLLSMINVAFVYLYILEKNNKIIYIYRLNGATKTTCIFLLANVIFIIALISFVCGCIFSRCVLPSIIEYVQYEDFTYSLGIYDYISMIIVYFIVIIITSAPVISKYVKNISISEKRLG